MIYVNCGQHDQVIKLLEGYEGDVKFIFKGKTGIKLSFESNTDDDSAVELAKAVIKASDLGKSLYFQVIK
ncbi:hypothetical protein [Anaerorhabdus sp.]|jgi:hypothetical protein|uniref:hypothetical protein n=1 Tax=Anaerorhabdus sp. TaxID=1872524 RepID=UPI002FCC8245